MSKKKRKKSRERRARCSTSTMGTGPGQGLVHVPGPPRLEHPNPRRGDESRNRVREKWGERSRQRGASKQTGRPGWHKTWSMQKVVSLGVCDGERVKIVNSEYKMGRGDARQGMLSTLSPKYLLLGDSGEIGIAHEHPAALGTSGPRGHCKSLGQGAPREMRPWLQCSLSPRSARTREEIDTRHELGGGQPGRRVRHERGELRQRETPPVADRSDRQRQVPRAGVGERGEERLPHPVEARGQAGLQPRRGRRPLQGYRQSGILGRGRVGEERRVRQLWTLCLQSKEPGGRVGPARQRPERQAWGPSWQKPQEKGKRL